jgi:hypothetical protein
VIKSNQESEHKIALLVALSRWMIDVFGAGNPRQRNEIEFYVKLFPWMTFNKIK